MPNLPSSRPKPDRFTPPNGSSTPSAPTALMNTMPASSRSATRLACSLSVVKTADPHPTGGAARLADPHARLEPVGDPLGLFLIGGENVGPQPERGVIGQFDGLFF